MGSYPPKDWIRCPSRRCSHFVIDTLSFFYLYPVDRRRPLRLSASRSFSSFKVSQHGSPFPSQRDTNSAVNGRVDGMRTRNFPVPYCPFVVVGCCCCCCCGLLLVLLLLLLLLLLFSQPDKSPFMFAFASYRQAGTPTPPSYRLSGMKGEGATEYRGIMQTLSYVSKNHGVRALWKGNGANVVRVMPVYAFKARRMDRI